MNSLLEHVVDNMSEDEIKAAMELFAELDNPTIVEPPARITGKFTVMRMQQEKPDWHSFPCVQAACNLNAARLQLRFPEYRLCGGRIKYHGTPLYGVDNDTCGVHWIEEQKQVQLLGHVWLQHKNGNIIDCFWENYDADVYWEYERLITAAPKLIKKRRSPVCEIKVPVHEGKCFKMTPKALKRLSLEYVECLTPRAERWLREFVEAVQEILIKK